MIINNLSFCSPVVDRFFRADEEWTGATGYCYWADDGSGVTPRYSFESWKNFYHTSSVCVPSSFADVSLVCFDYQLPPSPSFQLLNYGQAVSHLSTRQFNSLFVSKCTNCFFFFTVSNIPRIWRCCHSSNSIRFLFAPRISWNRARNVSAILLLFNPNNR